MDARPSGRQLNQDEVRYYEWCLSDAALTTEAPFKRLRTMTPPLPGEAVTLRMRGLNIQWPFSQLLLMGVKTEEVRRYDLGYKCITKKDEDVWIVETKGRCTKADKHALLDGLTIASRPSHTDHRHHHIRQGIPI